MSTSAKKCPPKNVKKAKYNMASPISNDRAEAFVGPQADCLPRFSEVPSEQDAKAFRLAAQGMTQREIAKELKTSQPTVQRGIKKYRLWFGSTLPEDRGELVGWQRFRVAVEEQRIFLRHQQELAMEEWHQSRQSVPMKRKRTKLDPDGQKVDGMKIKDIQIDEWVQHRRGSASHLNVAAKRSLELTMLEGGYLGVHKLSCDLAIDTDERDRWDRAVKFYQKTIEELKRKVAELEAKLAALCPGSGVFGTSDSPSPATPQPKTEDPLARHDHTMSGAGHVAAGPKTLAEPRVLDESRIASPSPLVDQPSPDSAAASPVQKALSGDRPDSPPAEFQGVNQVNLEQPKLGAGLPTPPLGSTAGLLAAEAGGAAGDLRSGVSAGSETRAEQREETCVVRSVTSGGRESLAAKVNQEGESGALKTPDPGPPPEPKYRWEDSFRQEALDYHCLKFGLPPATTDMATGIPDPFKMSPRMWMERGFPYQIYIDRDIPCNRRNPLDTMGVIKLACPPVVSPEGW